MRNTSRALWGLLFIVAGVGIAGNILGFWNFTLFFDGWWTLFLIIPGVISMIQFGINVPNSILVIIGGLLLLDRQNIIPQGYIFQIMFPAILVLIGVSIIFGGAFGRRRGSAENSGNENTRPHFGSGSYRADFNQNPEYVAIFSGNSVRNSTDNLLGGSASAIFGSMDIDLREAKFSKDITFTATAMFGGVTILAPQNARVETIGTPIFGGFENKALSSSDQTLPKITFNCTAIFGGVEIK